MAELKIDLLRWQKVVIQDKTRFKVICAGRRVGKTRYSLSQTLIKALECTDVSASVMFIAPTNQMARTLAWDALIFMAQPVIANSNVNNGEIRLKNGVKICIRGSDNPDSLRGIKLYHVTLDEIQDIKPQTWEYIIRPALSDMKGTAVFIGTPKPEAEEFRKLYELGLQNDDDNEWKSFTFTTYDNELISRKEIESAKNTLSTAAFEGEYMASWDTAGANILRLEWFKTDEAPVGDYSTFIAIDPAGYTSVADHEKKKKHLDFFAIAVVRVYSNGHWWVQKIDYGRWDVREASMRVLMAIRTHHPMCIGIEKGSLMRAIMPYLSDLMRKNNIYAHIEEIATSGNSKTNRITYALQGLMEHGRITFNPKENWDELKREMLAFPSVRAHDDLIDALSQIAYMAITTYHNPNDDDDEYEPFDLVVGF